MTGDDLELAREAAGEVAGKVTEVFVAKSGVLEPIRALTLALSTAADAVIYPPLVRFCQRAASKIEARGLSPKAIDKLPPRLLRGILEGGALETDEGMQEHWVNLLANAVTDSGNAVRIAFPTILGELEPTDARLLDELASRYTPHTPVVDVSQSTSAERASLDNLARLELVRYAGEIPTAANGIKQPLLRSSDVTLTAFGVEFLRACREPGALS